MIDKTISVRYFVKHTFHKDYVDYLFYDRASRKWREDTMIRTDAENLISERDTTETKKFGLETWRVITK
jgi:hypothetical protein